MVSTVHKPGPQRPVCITNDGYLYRWTALAVLCNMYVINCIFLQVYSNVLPETVYSYVQHMCVHVCLWQSCITYNASMNTICLCNATDGCFVLHTRYPCMPSVYITTDGCLVYHTRCQLPTAGYPDVYRALYTHYTQYKLQLVNFYHGHHFIYNNPNTPQTTYWVKNHLRKIFLFVYTI